ncbi:MAG: DUF6198 family protein [Eubacterium sp.]|nr:DUF6198 family protein [Eubacterium sp.]
MNKTEILRKYFIFFIGLVINAVGVVFLTKAALGNSPSACVPFALSETFSLTYGQFTIIMNLILIGAQILIGRKNYPLIQLLQIPVSVAFGFMIDFFMDTVFFWMSPQTYLMRLVFTLLGCVILALSVFLEFSADVLMLPGEGLAFALHCKTGLEKGHLKIAVDVGLVAAACVIGLIFSHEIIGIREGTLLAAVLVGAISKQYNIHFGRKLIAWCRVSSATPAPANS